MVACWLKFAMLGINYKNKGTLRSKTSREYAEAVAELFALRGFPSPVNFDDPLNSITILVANQKKEEDVANQRRPLTLLIYAQLQKMAEEAGQDSLEACVFNIVSIGKTVGPRACEFAQKTQTKVKVHRYPSGKEVIKAWIGCDWKFNRKCGKPITAFTKKDQENLGGMKIKWRIQKNRQNNQELGLKADNENPVIDSCHNASAMVK